ncbi:MAG: hypothetical protein V2J10_02825 [Wenzhouxiangella sp.]|jgi:hypothetical protein|nr:hypothetical protein [Wenzhouxiangella sp.]
MSNEATPHRRPSGPGLIAIALALTVSACAALQPTDVPIPAQWHVGDAPSDTLIVLLPGSGDSPEQFERSGIIELLTDSGLDWDAVAVDAHMGYYRERSVVDRIEADIIAPAKARGYRTIWLSGPSLGGFGSLLYWCRTRDEDIAGIIALAPYLGDEDILDEVEAAGPLDRWTPAGAGRDHEVAIWRCIQDGFPDDLAVWLAWGRSDRMAPGNRLLARELPEERVINSEGGHLWTVWKPLWARAFEAIADDAPGS